MLATSEMETELTTDNSADVELMASGVAAAASFLAALSNENLLCGDFGLAAQSVAAEVTAANNKFATATSKSARVTAERLASARGVAATMKTIEELEASSALVRKETSARQMALGRLTGARSATDVAIRAAAGRVAELAARQTLCKDLYTPGNKVDGDSAMVRGCKNVPLLISHGS